MITQQKPIGGFLLLAPLVLGKPVATQLANALGVKLLRFDMSEYMEKNGASQLVGAPGYVGFEQGRFTEAVIKNPTVCCYLMR